ncbi:hypothetical protein CEXT_452341 [Caerostris extrusa]|uniref:Uncharacterized protein n=1 Tax=Caerostris extrusa TaxID=172846 RepID=A0AAV4YBF7_CAEEX|nr:hypothetical protein CEXT_452341 [Caerostris extrusa]
MGVRVEPSSDWGVLTRIIWQREIFKINPDSRKYNAIPLPQTTSWRIYCFKAIYLASKQKALRICPSSHLFNVRHT